MPTLTNPNRRATVPRRKRSHIIRYYGAQSPYLLRDEFTTARSAGAVDGTLAEPGPGTRRVTDTGSKLILSNGYVTLNGNPSAGWNDPDLYYTPSGEIGAAMFEFMVNGTVGICGMLLSPTDRPADPTITGVGVYHNTLYLYNIPDCAGANKLKLNRYGKPLRAILYHIYVIRRPTAGSWVIASGGVFGSGTLLWVNDTDDITTTTYLGLPVQTGSDSPNMDGFQAVGFNKLAAPFTTDYGPCTARDTFQRANSAIIGNTEIGNYNWNHKIGTVVIDSNHLKPSAASLVCFDPATQPKIIVAEAYVPDAGGAACQIEIIFRHKINGIRDDGLYVGVNKATTVLYQDGVNLGTSGTTDLVVDQSNKIVILDFGDYVRCFVNNALVLDIAASAHTGDAAYTEIGAGCWQNNAVGYFTSFTIYPASITPPAIFSALPAPAAGSGAAIFTDAFTDADATELSAHNAAWIIGSGTWEINSNKARMTADGVTGYAVTEAGTVDHEVEFTVTTPNTEPAGAEDWFCGGVVRWTNTNNYIAARMLYASSSEIEIIQLNGGSSSVIKFIGNMAWAKNTAYTFKIACKGSDVCVYLAGELMCQVRAAVLTGTKCGIGATATGGASNRPTWDDVTVKAVV